MPLNSLYASGHLVTGGASVRLRLTALVLLVVSILLAEASAFSAAAGSPIREKRSMYPFNRANGRSIDEKPGTDRIPEGFGSFNGSAPAQSEGVRLDKRAGVQPEGGWRPFGYFSGEGKVPLRSKPASKKEKIPRRAAPPITPGPGGKVNWPKAKRGRPGLRSPRRKPPGLANPRCVPARPAAGPSALHGPDAPARPAQSRARFGPCRRPPASEKRRAPCIFT